MLKESKIAHVDGCLVNENEILNLKLRVTMLEARLGKNESFETMEAMSSGTTFMALDMRQGWENCKEDCALHRKKFLKCLADLEAKFNYEILKIKNYINENLR